MKYVKSLTDTQEVELTRIYKTSGCHQTRQRAQAILLSAKGFCLKTLADIFSVDRDTVSCWIDDWHEFEYDGLENDPKSGTPKKLTEAQEKEALDIILETPRQIKLAIQKIKDKFGKTVSEDWIKRLLKKNNYNWKRLRKSLKNKRKELNLEAEFEQAKKELKQLQTQEDAGEIDLIYFDQSGFSLTPAVPYAWQKIGEHILLPCASSPRLNVLGFLNRQNQFTPFVYEQSVTADVVIACMDQFVKTITKTTCVVIDNAPMHTSAKFQSRIVGWKEKGLIIKQIPRYSPELNLIEILWRKIKYEWLPFSAYQNFGTLKLELEKVLCSVGQKYRITFA